MRWGVDDWGPSSLSIVRAQHPNYRKKTVKTRNTWRLNSAPLNNQEVTEDIKEEIKKYIKTNDNENTMTQDL